MSRMTYERALGIVAERTHDNRKDIRQKNLQRRNPVTDLYGIPHYSRGSADDPALFYISVSKDYTYYNRFQFKLAIRCKSNVSNFHISIEGYDITDYLMEQQGIQEGEQLIEGQGLYPINEHDDDPTEDESIDDYYDLLDVSQVMMAEYEAETDEDKKHKIDVKRRRLMMPGFKEVQISADGDFEATLYLYLKYANINR